MTKYDNSNSSNAPKDNNKKSTSDAKETISHDSEMPHRESDNETRVAPPRHVSDNTPDQDGSIKSQDKASETSKYEDGTILQALDTSQPGSSNVSTTDSTPSAVSDLKSKKREIILKDRFKLLSVIGSGGMGTVYKALDLRKVEAKDLEPYIALKVLGKQIKDHPYAFVALQREAKNTQKLAHPNILTVHDFDRDGNVTFLTMELLNGESLDKVIAKHRSVGMPYKKALKIIKDFCAALEYAHQHSIIHLDFKPNNIFVTDQNTKVLDFGIARVTKDKQNPKDFDAGSLNALTPIYASLEMLQGKDPDPRDDIFSAAIICYELLTGRHPFNRKPADQAYAEKLKPKRIKGLKKSQWKALEAALAFERDSRTPTVKKFITGFSQVRKRHFIQAAAVLLIVATAGWLSYDKYFSEYDISKMVDKTMTKAKQCFSTKDYACTIDNANAALNIKPNDTAAKHLLELARLAQHQTEINNIVNQANQCFKKDDFACVLAYVDMLTEKAPDSKEIQSLKDQVANKKQQVNIKSTLEAANKCFNAQNYQCAVENANSVLEIAVKNETALTIKTMAEKNIAKINNETARIATLIEDKLHSANTCYDDKRYHCTIDNANEVLKYKPGNQKAASLKQKALFAIQIMTENQARVNNILKNGKACLNRKDYSCAIAKSESALEIIPDSKAALALRKEAKEAIDKIKASITIQ